MFIWLLVVASVIILALMTRSPLLYMQTTEAKANCEFGQFQNRKFGCVLAISAMPCIIACYIWAYMVNSALLSGEFNPLYNGVNELVNSANVISADSDMVWD